MPALNHVNLTVPDARETADFFEEIFGFRTIAERNNGGFIILLSEDDAFVLTLQTDVSGTAYPTSFHVGFHQPDKATVVAMQQRIQRMGYDAPDAAHLRSHEAFGFYMKAPGGVQVEVSTLLLSLEEFAARKTQLA